MLRNTRKTRASTELVAAAVENMAAPAAHPTIRSYQAAASALSPAVFPTERYRTNTKAMMLREFARPSMDSRADAGSRDGLDSATGNVVRVEAYGSTVTLADIEPVDQLRAHDAAEAIEAILDRHERRARHA